MVISSRRSEFEIIRDILIASFDGAKKTHILYRTNLSYSQLQDYLSFLIKAGVVEAIKKGSSEIYRITEKGKELLNHIEGAIYCLKGQSKTL